MGQPLRVLVIEDDVNDHELLLREIQRGGYDVECERVETATALCEALDRQRWDVVLSDYSLPSFDAPRALAIIKDRRIDVPFIIVSGTVDEVTAVASMRAGAHDFMAKGKLARLLPVIDRELREAAGRADRRRMQEQLLVSDRMASLGTLAAGVAHEINSPLAAILANLEVVMDDLAALAPAALARPPHAADWAAWVRAQVEKTLEPLHDACEAALRVRDVSRDLKVFSRGDEQRLGAVDVRQVMESSLRMAQNEIRHRAELVREYSDVPPVHANDTRLGQVFLNLVVNAVQSLPEESAERHRIRVVIRPEAEGRVCVEVHDTGAGIPADVLPQIFDPFFTTKPIGVGTGLGLAICHRIVTSLGGEITVQSERGVGSVFSVSLPVAAEPTIDATPAAVAPQSTSAPRGRILAIDDDVMVSGALQRLFGGAHEVSAANSAREALERFAAGERFDLILCDILMPEYTGIELFDRLSDELPEQAARMVFMTGGAFTPEARAFIERVPERVIEKPFDLPTLRALVDEMLS
ncbi:MAG TPA: response regulator [Nannocystaceae bacterium]|nr:response regulator [Nannocystaceae bacterium]